MLKRNKKIVLLGALLVAAAAGGWLWLSAPAEQNAANWKAPTVRKAEAPSLSGSGGAADSAGQGNGPAGDNADGAGERQPDTIDSILGDDSLEFADAARLLGKIVVNPAYPMSERKEALVHMQNLALGSERELVGPLLKSQDMTDSLASDIFDASFNRSFDWQADVALSLLERGSTGTELRTRAIDHLEFLTDESHGSDLEAWRRVVEKLRPSWTEGTE